MLRLSAGSSPPCFFLGPVGGSRTGRPSTRWGNAAWTPSTGACCSARASQPLCLVIEDRTLTAESLDGLVESLPAARVLLLTQPVSGGTATGRKTSQPRRASIHCPEAERRRAVDALLVPSYLPAATAPDRAHRGNPLSVRARARSSRARVLSGDASLRPRGASRSRRPSSLRVALAAGRPAAVSVGCREGRALRAASTPSAEGPQETVREALAHLREFLL